MRPKPLKMIASYLANLAANAEVHARMKSHATELEVVTLDVEGQIDVGRRREGTLDYFVSHGAGSKGWAEVATQAMGLRHDRGTCSSGQH